MKTNKTITVTIVDPESSNKGEKQQWTLKKVLAEINKDSSELWEDYNENDWHEGWSEWVQGEFYYIEKSLLRSPNYFSSFSLIDKLNALAASFSKKLSF